MNAHFGGPICWIGSPPGGVSGCGRRLKAAAQLSQGARGARCATWECHGEVGLWELQKGGDPTNEETGECIIYIHSFTIMKILPANSEGCWLFSFVIFLSFFVIWFCIFLSFLFCGVIFLSFVKSFFVIFLSFVCRFLVVFYFLALFIFLSFSHKDQASGEGGKPGLGNAKNCKK